MSLLTIHNDVCDDYRRSPIENSGGDTVFAGQTVSFGGFMAEEYPVVSKKKWDAVSGGKMIVLYGCIDYQFPDQPGHHQSRFSFVAGRTVDQGTLNRVSFLPNDPTTVDIRLMSVPIGDNEKPAD